MALVTLISAFVYAVVGLKAQDTTNQFLEKVPDTMHELLQLLAENSTTAIRDMFPGQGSTPVEPLPTNVRALQRSDSLEPTLTSHQIFAHAGRSIPWIAQGLSLNVQRYQDVWKAVAAIILFQYCLSGMFLITSNNWGRNKIGTMLALNYLMLVVISLITVVYFKWR